MNNAAISIVMKWHTNVCTHACVEIKFITGWERRRGREKKITAKYVFYKNHLN